MFGGKIKLLHGRDTRYKRYEELQKVCRLTQLITRYVHNILSLFNIVYCNWNARGLAFVQSSDSVAEELLILLFQPGICCADNAFPSKLPLCVRDLYPHPIHGSLGPPNSIPQTASRSVEPYCDRQTDRQTMLLRL